MICDLTYNEKPELVYPRAFEKTAERYHIGRVATVLSVKGSVYTGEESRTESMYRSDKPIKDKADHMIEFVTGEKGQVSFRVYRLKGYPEFTEEEKRELDTILNIMMLHAGRWRLISQIKRVSMTDELTGLVNAGGYLTYVDKLLVRKELSQYNAFYMNLERFSLVNKRFGVKETDTIIQRYEVAVQNFLVEGECIGRIGGDNFVGLIKKERTQQFIDFIKGVPVYGMIGSQQIKIFIGARAGMLEIDDKVVDCGIVINDCAMALHVAKKTI